MENVEFDDQRYKSARQNTPSAQSPSALIRLGFALGAKDQRQAEHVLIGIAVIAIVIAIWLLSSQFLVGENPTLAPNSPPIIVPTF